MLVHWFNPENDLALASNSPFYTPKKAAVAMRESGVTLPLWYGNDGDSVLAYGVNARWYDTMLKEFDLKTILFDHNVTADCVPEPWGWSNYTRHRFEKEGFHAETLPTPVQIHKMRGLSHRRTASALASALRDKLPGMNIGVPALEFTDMEGARGWMDSCSNCYIKHPWSGSGRGVVSIASAGRNAALRFADDSIRLQGSVLLEPAYQRVVDFALLYRCEAGKCSPLGTSVFTTDEHSAYSGNLLAPEGTRRAVVAQHLPAADLDAVDRAVAEIIERLISPYYNGVLGVDMIVDTQGVLAVMEINLRKTMGYVSNVFSERYLATGATGTLRIVPVKNARPDSWHACCGRMDHGVLHLNQPGTALVYEITVA